MTLPVVSGSAATTVVMAVVFSATLMAAVGPPPFDVMIGTTSFVSVMVTAMAWSSNCTPSDARTVTL